MYPNLPPTSDNVMGLHIEPTNICTLKCPGCARTRFIQQWSKHWQNHSINVDSLMSFLDIDIAGKMVRLCGNYGDPIYHPDFANLVARLKQRGCTIDITTNGSYKTADWWEHLVSLLDAGDSVTFSVDGTPENFMQYRINADWSSIKTAIEICANSTVQTIWKYIPFAYNVDDIDQVRSLSESLGIDQFYVDPSDRFDEQTIHLKPPAEHLGPRYASQQQWANTKSTAGIKPKCLDGQQHFISADGFYVPCCHLQDHRFYYKTVFGKQKILYNIENTTLSQILYQPTVVEFYQDLPKHHGCQFNCPQP